MLHVYLPLFKAHETIHFVLFARPRLSINTGTVKETRAQSVIEVKGPKASTRNFYLQSTVNCSFYFLARIFAHENSALPGTRCGRELIKNNFTCCFPFDFFQKKKKNNEKFFYKTTLFYSFSLFANINLFRIFIYDIQGDIRMINCK